MEDITFIIDTAKEAMDKAVKHLEKEFLNIKIIAIIIYTPKLKFKTKHEKRKIILLSPSSISPETGHFESNSQPVLQLRGRPLFLPDAWWTMQDRGCAPVHELET